jgi:predicted nucleotidyltransferase
VIYKKIIDLITAGIKFFDLKKILSSTNEIDFINNISKLISSDGISYNKEEIKENLNFFIEKLQFLISKIRVIKNKKKFCSSVL